MFGLSAVARLYWYIGNDYESKLEEAVGERTAVPQLRDVLKREHDEAQKRPRNIALEKWGPLIEAEIEAELARERREARIARLMKSPTPRKHPGKDGPDMDMG